EEHDNFRAALKWTMDDRQLGNRDSVTESRFPIPDSRPSIVQIETALRMAGALWRFWLVHGYYSEGRDHLNKALERSDVLTFRRSNPWVAKALNGAAVMAWRQNDFDG